jgi:formylmethanofuran dehydrogenase subunit D
MAWEDGNVSSVEVLIIAGDTLFDRKNYKHAVRKYQEAYNSAMCIKNEKTRKSLAMLAGDKLKEAQRLRDIEISE